MYEVLFYEALVETAIDWFDGYDGQVFEIRNIREAGRNTEIRTQFFYADGRPINATWTTRLIDGKYLFRDIRVAGISLMADFRGRYKQIIDREGFEGFLNARRRYRKAQGKTQLREPSDSPEPGKTNSEG